ncbi:MAG: short chain dehydrogenase [Gammaproteobacteria bacterium]|jgi:NAD(P)-dependent dehydrogenase (short-subunit alcohol dehydrogenase family)|nr:short chain dehydrogenase [Gammaproteobacteria bacterium]
MKVLLVGGTGVIGSAVCKELGSRHDVITAGSKSGDVKVDMTVSTSIEEMYKKLGSIDAVIITAGVMHFGPLELMTEEQFYVGIKSKFMGQVNLVLQGQKYLNENGSFTLTSGVLALDPIRMGASATAINSAIDGFVKGAAIDLLKGHRINAVSPTVVVESMPQLASFFPGFVPASAALVALAYVRSVEGAQTGQIYRVGY